ncbi:hypothetical protein LFREDSHE_09010 [Shewanella baltica]
MTTSSNSSRKRTQRDYTLAFKLGIVERVEKGEMTYKQAQTRFGIQGKTTVLVWLRKHGKLDWSKLFQHPLCLIQKKPQPKLSSALSVS